MNPVVSPPLPMPPDLHAAVLDALARVHDPEMGENLVDLGLVLDVALAAGELRVTLIPTSVTCPMADVILDDAWVEVERICPPGLAVEVAMDWDTAWSPERLAPALKARFGW